MGDLEQSLSVERATLESGSLAREMSRGYLKLVEWYRQEMQLSAGEADEKARAHHDREWARRALDQPADQVSWAGLGALAEHDPEAAGATWERIKAAARDELASGHRAAAVLECTGGPWERAQFLAIRTAFREEWQPRGGIEAALVDQMAQAHAYYQHWLSRLHVQASTEARMQDAKRQRDGYWDPPRVDTAEAMDQAAGMTDRFHRLFLRALRALRDLRRYAPTIVVANAGQVNVSGGSQLNVGGVMHSDVVVDAE